MNRMTGLLGASFAVVVTLLLVVPTMVSAHHHDEVQFEMSLSSGDEVISEPTIQTVNERPVELNSVTESGDEQDSKQLNVELTPTVDGDEVRLTGGIESEVDGDVATSVDVERSVVSGEGFVIDIDNISLEVRATVMSDG